MGLLRSVDLAGRHVLDLQVRSRQGGLLQESEAVRGTSYFELVVASSPIECALPIFGTLLVAERTLHS